VAQYGINVTALCPGTTESEFFEVARAGVFRTRKLQSAQEVARLGLAALVRGQRTIIPKWSGWFTAFLVRFVPVGLITRVVEKGARPKPVTTRS
jgi:short-subunit dehydrogenase